MFAGKKIAKKLREERMGPIRRIERTTAIRAVRGGLVNIIPVLIIGAFALILNTFPVEAYQKFISNFAGGFLVELFNTVHSATFGMLSVYMTYSISRAYMKLKGDSSVVFAGATFASLLAFFVLAGVNMASFGTDETGPKSMFLAIIAGLCSSSLYLRLSKTFRKNSHTLFSSGADGEFNRMLSTLVPIAIVAVTVTVVNEAVVRLCGVASFRELLVRLLNALFSYGRTDFFKGLLFVILSSVLWFFGIHGSDTLEEVMQTCFVPGLSINQAAAAAGGAPTQVLTKEFFDCFVLMGGCGSTICLLIALLIFSKNRARRGLALTASVPMLFNINELMVFGLPVIFNPVMLIPFLTVPVVCYLSAYAAISTGLVPMIASEVAWTTPVILGGIRATGSAAGALLQLFNIAVGVLIYMPFVREMDRRTSDEAERMFAEFLDFFRKNESALANSNIIELKNINGQFAKGLCAELFHDVEKSNKNIMMAYQPQYNYDGRCVGVEALLRWRHAGQGYIYPPLVVKLAEDGGFLPQLEETIVRKVLEDRPKVLERFGDDVKISFNITGTTVVTQRFLQFLQQLNAKDPFEGKHLCVEVTEQAALALDDSTMSAFKQIHGLGLMLAIDDFSMGQTSLHYLEDNTFDLIKLDGSLVKGMFTHQNVREIIASIVKLSLTLNLAVLAEFVETEEERETLHEMGCDNYQGYLYSPAVFLE